MKKRDTHISLYKKVAFILPMIVVISFALFSCKKKELTNPYAGLTHVVYNDNPSVDELPEGSFAWLHAKIFRPTCANSGCHDGTFEPEFRGIGSAYSSLVNHPTIANTPGNTFQYRVKPGDANASFLHERLTTFVPFSSGMMPLVTDPGSDWPANRDSYISKITDWINSGAKDIYGNAAPDLSSNLPPMIYGLAVFPQGNTTNPYPRQTNSPYGIGAIEVPAQMVDVWIFAYDDNAYPNLFNGITLQASTSVLDFTNALQSNFVVSGPINAIPFGDGDPAPFYYKATLNLSSAAPGGYYYLRNFMDDGQQSSLTVMPNNSSNPFWFLIFSLKIV